VNAWRAAAHGPAHLFVIRGEAGIGKTRLAEEFVIWARSNGVAAVTARCYASEGRLAYAPIAAWLRSDVLKPALAALEPAWASDVARLRPELLAERPEVPAPSRQLENWQRLAFFDALARAFRGAAPLALIVDDLQWADGDTIDWLQHFVRSTTDTPCLVVGTVRAEEEQDNPPLGRLVSYLERDRLLTSIALGPLDRTATTQLAGEVAEHPLDDHAAARTFKETEGHPLFIIERGRMALASHSEAAEPALPQVQSVVAARLALLSDDARGVAQVAAAVGRDFRFDLLAEASDLEEAALVRALDELWRRHIVRVQADERWDFSHDRIREVAYAGIGPAHRRLIHRRIAQGMERLFADRLDDVSASIAVHLDRGGLPARAVPFLERGAAVALRISATEEAIRCLNYALALLERLPPGPERDAQELALRASLSIPLNIGRGYAAPDVEANLDRVFALSVTDGRAEVPVRWLWVAFALRYMLGDSRGARDVSERALALSQSDPSFRCEAHHAMGGTLLSVGELVESKRHFELAIAAYHEADPKRSALGSDLGVFAHAWFTQTLWLLGEDAAAVSSAERSIAIARKLDHLYSQTIALAYSSLLHQLRGDVDQMLACATETIALCERYGFAYYGDWARALAGWARGLERPDEGVMLMERALEQLDAQRAQARRPYYLSLLADTYARLGNRDRVGVILDSAIAMSLDRGEAWWLPALYLQKSALEPPDTALATRERGLALARAQGNRALEARILGSAGPAVSRTLSRTL
jgi:tetratricopeptide (TPR) repeat protein